MKTKIGLITFHSSINYGAMLQAYALQQYLLSCGNECVIIDYVTRSHELEYLPDKKSRMPQKNLVRYQRFMIFMKKRMKLTQKRYYTEKELIEDFPMCDIYMTGSDQVWNLDFVDAVSDVYFLNLQCFKNRIAYGPSSGSCKLKKINVYKEYLQNYEFIFTREKELSRYLTRILNKDVKTVVDPTLLLNREHWKKFVKRSKRKKPYLLFYIVGDDDYSFKMAQTVATVLGGLDIITVSYAQTYRGKNVYNCVSAGPVGFLNLVYNAEFVFTTSFHGSIFSIIYDIPFYTILQNKNDSRIRDLVINFGLKSRMLGKESNIPLSKDVILERPGIGDRQLEQFTESSKRMLHMAIEKVLKK